MSLSLYFTCPVVVLPISSVMRTTLSGNSLCAVVSLYQAPIFTDAKQIAIVGGEAVCSPFSWYNLISGGFMSRTRLVKVT